MNDQLSDTTAAAPGVVSGHTGAMAFVPQAAPLPGPALTREDIPGLVNAAPEGEEQLDADWLWDEVVGVAIAPHWSAEYILQLRNALLRERQQNLEASEQARRDEAARQAQSPDRAYRTFRETYAVPPTPEKWIEEGGEGLTGDQCIEALRSTVKSQGARLLEQGWAIERLKNALAELKSKQTGRIPRPPNGRAA